MPIEIPRLHSTVPVTVNAATEQLRTIEKVQDLIERIDELSSEEAITLFGALQSLGCLDHGVMLEQHARAVHLAAHHRISAYYDAHREDPSDEQLKEMRIQTATELGAGDVALLLEHDPDRYQGFIERFFDIVTRKLKEEQPSKRGTNG